LDSKSYFVSYFATREYKRKVSRSYSGHATTDCLICCSNSYSIQGQYGQYGNDYYGYGGAGYGGAAGAGYGASAAAGYGGGAAQDVKPVDYNW